MKLKSGPWDGAQPRKFVLDVIRSHGVVITSAGDDDFLFDDRLGYVVILHVPQPVPSEVIQLLHRQFGSLGFEITDLVRKH